MKKAVRIALCILLAVAVFCAILYGLYYAWWGNYHAVLYTVQRVTAAQDAHTDGLYHLTFEIEAKNWPHDRRQHTYSLRAVLEGSYGAWDFAGGCERFTTDNTPTDFTASVDFDTNSVFPDERLTQTEDLVRQAVQFCRFWTYDENGERMEHACLFMSDYPDIEVDFQ